LIFVLLYYIGAWEIARSMVKIPTSHKFGELWGALIVQNNARPKLQLFHVLQFNLFQQNGL